MNRSELKYVRLKQKEANKHFDEFLKLDKKIWKVCKKNLPKQIEECESEQDLHEVLLFINYFYDGFHRSRIFMDIRVDIYKRRYELGLVKDN